MGGSAGQQDTRTDTCAIDDPWRLTMCPLARHCRQAASLLAGQPRSSLRSRLTLAGGWQSPCSQSETGRDPGGALGEPEGPAVGPERSPIGGVGVVDRLGTDHGLDPGTKAAGGSLLPSSQDQTVFGST